MDDTLFDARTTHDIGRRSNRSRDLSASLTRLELSIARVRRRTILFACWGIIMIAAISVRIMAEVR